MKSIAMSYDMQATFARRYDQIIDSYATAISESIADKLMEALDKLPEKSNE